MKKNNEILKIEKNKDIIKTTRKHAYSLFTNVIIQAIKSSVQICTEYDNWNNFDLNFHINNVLSKIDISKPGNIEVDLGDGRIKDLQTNTIYLKEVSNNQCCYYSGYKNGKPKPSNARLCGCEVLYDSTFCNKHIGTVMFTDLYGITRGTKNNKKTKQNYIDEYIEKYNIINEEPKDKKKLKDDKKLKDIKK